jgi:hypothetical protein
MAFSAKVWNAPATAAFSSALDAFFASLIEPIMSFLSFVLVFQESLKVYMTAIFQFNFFGLSLSCSRIRQTSPSVGRVSLLP